MTILLLWFICQLVPAKPAGSGAAQGQTALHSTSELWVLAVGVSQYSQPELRLRFAAADARAVAAALKKQAGGPLYRAVHTRVLVDQEVTREAILDGLLGFLARARPSDIAVLFLAGHGVQDRSTGGYYFLPAPATTENYVSTGVRMTDLDELLRVVRRSARGVIVMLDTCHAGALRSAAPQLEALDDPAARLHTGEGFFLLAASKPGEESEEHAELGHGVFTYAILRGLVGPGDTDGNGQITVTELFGYVTRTVASITAERQHPYSKVEGTDFAFITPRLRQGAPPPITHQPSSSSYPARSETVVTNSVAVMTFQNLRSDPQHEWIGVALRTAFNTELSKVKALQVYAPELVDRALLHGGGDLLSVARQLGIERLITGSFNIVGNEIRIDAHIVYSRTGLQEGSDSVQGPLDAFFTLQRQLVFSLLRRMHVAIPEEMGRAGERGSLDALRLLLESEGEIEPVPERTPPLTPKAPQQPHKNSGWFPRSLWWSLASPAWADEMPPVQHEVLKVLEQYRQALIAKDVAAFARLYTEFSPQRRSTLARYFENAVDLTVDIEDIRWQSEGEDVVVSFLRRDRFTDRQTGKPVTLEVRLTRRLVKVPDGWRIAGKP